MLEYKQTEGQDIAEVILHSIIVGQKFDNPGRGTSIICKKNNDCITYKRGKSTINLKTADIVAAFKMFTGTICRSVDLQQWRPQIFDSKKSGHSCNCTFLFLLLNYIGIIEGGIQGKGVRGNPYYVHMK